MQNKLILSTLWLTGSLLIVNALPPALNHHELPQANYEAAVTVSGYATKVFISGVGAGSAEGVIAELNSTLNLLGLTSADLVNVRGSLLATEQETLVMDPWNRAWVAWFDAGKPRASRTTIGASSLPGGSTITIVAEAVAAYMADMEEDFAGTPSLNPFIRFFGEGIYGSSSAALIKPGSALLFSSGVLADPVDLGIPEGNVQRYGDMVTQSESIFKKLQASLRDEGFAWEDVFYVRALLSPEPAGTEVDFDGFEQAFKKHFMERHPAMKPALTVWAAPGFSATGRIVEIEVYAAAADARGPFVGATPGVSVQSLKYSGSETSRISSTAVVARFQDLTWFSGAIGTAGTMHDESVTTLMTLRNRAKAAGIDLSQTIQMRAYPVVGNSFASNMTEWNEAYARFFAHPLLNPVKPARTSFPVTSLPRGLKMEVELIVAGPDR